MSWNGKVGLVGAMQGELWQALYGALWYVPAVQGLFVFGKSGFGKAGNVVWGIVGRVDAW